MKKANPDAPRDSPAKSHLQFRMITVSVTAFAPKSRFQREQNTPSMTGRSSEKYAITCMPGRKKRCYQCSLDGVKTTSGENGGKITGSLVCQVTYMVVLATANSMKTLKNQ